ncbi:unnamed protein product, partial [Polarella glacialis]
NPAHLPMATAALAARRAGSPLPRTPVFKVGGLGRSFLQATPSPARRQVQNDLMQKLRAMDLALEQIEHAEEEVDAASTVQSSKERAGGGVRVDSGVGSKENLDPSV